MPMNRTFTPFMNSNIIEKAGSLDTKELIQALLSEYSEKPSADSGIEFNLPDKVMFELIKKLDLLRLERMN